MFNFPDPPRINSARDASRLAALLKHADISIADIKKMSDDEIMAVLNGESDIEGMVGPGLQAALQVELTRREIARATKRHWTVVPTFWLVVLTFLVAVASVFFQIAASK